MSLLGFFLGDENVLKLHCDDGCTIHIVEITESNSKAGEFYGI